MKLNLNSKSTSKVNLVGGIGNQLFGLVFGLAVSQFSGIVVIYDEKYISLGSNKNRKLELKNFLFKDYSGIQISKKYFWKLFCKIYILRKFLIKISRLLSTNINEKELNLKFQFRPGQVFEGYFQDWIYADYLFTKKNKFEVDLARKSDNLINFCKEYKNEDHIFVHVRLGDYTQLSNTYDLLPEEYYLSAIEVIKNRSPKSQVLLICENEIQTSNYYPNLVKICSNIVDSKFGLSDSEIFYILSTADKLVVSNSTFSLWPGWFVLNKNGQVIVPSKFKVSGVESKLIDDRWEKINLDNFKIVKKKELTLVRQQNVARFLELFS